MGLLCEEAKNLLFKTDFNKITVDVGTTVDRFLISHGVCREVTNINQLENVTVFVGEEKVQILITDPATLSIHGNTI